MFNHVNVFKSWVGTGCISRHWSVRVLTISERPSRHAFWKRASLSSCGRSRKPVYLICKRGWKRTKESCYKRASLEYPVKQNNIFMFLYLNNIFRCYAQFNGMFGLNFNVLSLVHQSLNLKWSEECNELVLAGCGFDATLISVNISSLCGLIKAE